ncbi:MAG: D-alanine--D-alanine ligase [Deltaproteobacteria bacterium]|nr:D-alanine--D-alanine ligase [Deltaproteobacteria bacterium]
MQVGVLMGGASSEREVSLKSGTAVLQALRKKGYKAVSLDAAENLVSLIRRHGIEVAFICLHGKAGEDGTVQGLLEVLGIPYTGSGVKSSAVAMDKILTKKLLRYHGIPTPDFVVIEERRKRYSGIPYPAVVKPADEGSTIGIARVATFRELQEAVGQALAYSDQVLVEQYVPGREVTVGILDQTPLPVVEVRPAGGFYDFAAKYESGDTEYLVPAPLSPAVTRKVQQAALRVHRLIGCSGVSRVDLILAKGMRPSVLEVNTIPGMTATSLLPKAAQAAGIPFGELVERILETALRGNKAGGESKEK